MGLFIQTNCDSGCRISPFSMSIFLFVTLSTVVSMIAAETVTTPFKTTTPSPAPSHAPSLIPSLDNECAESCETCPKNDSNSCLTCKDNLTLNPAENCTDIFISCNASEACMNECYDTDTVSCQCLLKHRDEKCKECIEELNNMYGTCIKADKCPRDTQSTDEVFSDLKNGTMPICLICEKLFIGYCVDIYIIGIVLIPISILVVLCILVGVAIRCYIQRRRGGGMEMECCCTLSSVKPPPPVRKDYTSRQQSFQTDHRNNETETESDDVYGNVDDRNNIMLHNAPLNQQIDPSERPKMHLPQAAPHNPLLPGVRNTQDRFRNDNDRPRMQLPQPPRSAQLPNVGNRPTQDSAIPKDQGYIKMKDNVMVDVPRFPPGFSRHTSESEPEEQAVYGNDPNLARQVTAPTRRPPSIPLKPVSSTLPAGINSSVAGRINKGFNNDDDDNPVDDYPDYPNDDDEQCDSIPLGYAPPPPVNHNRPGGGGHVAANELKQKLNSRMQKLRKESLSDLPEEPPPPVPLQGGRQSGGGQFNELQQKLKSRNEKTRNESLSDLPDRAPPPPNRTAQSRAQGGPFMSDLQKKFSNEFHGHMDGNKKPSLPPPVRVHSTQPDSDSDESQVDYEFVDYKDDKTSNTTPQSLTEPNVDRRPPIILPKSPTRTDQFNRPQVPFKKGPVMPPKKNQPPPLPKSPKPVADEQEVYEIMDTQEDDMSDRPVMPSDSFRENTRIENRPRVPLPVSPGSSVPGEDRPRMPPPPLRGNKPKPVVIEEDDEVYEAVESPDAKDYGDNYEVPEKPQIQLECDDVYQNEPVIKGKSGRYRNLPGDKNPAVIGTGGYTKWTKKY